MRMFRDSMYAMNRSEKRGLHRAGAESSAFSVRPAPSSWTPPSRPIRMGCAGERALPQKSPGPSTPTMASLPACDSTESLTAPFWMYMTLSPDPLREDHRQGLVLGDFLRNSSRFEKCLCIERRHRFDGDFLAGAWHCGPSPIIAYGLESSLPPSGPR